METTYNELNPQQLVDYISDLPEEVKIHILTVLDTRDAVRTSVLSTRWLRTWTHVPDLKLHLTLMDNRKMLSLDGTLASHALPKISKFHLRLEDCESVGSKMVDLLVGFAAARHVEGLSLDLSGLSCMYVLPEYFYYQCSLRELRTVSCCFFPKGGRGRRGSVNWESLRVLNVGVGRMKGKIEDVLSGCPSLESLSLCRVHLSGGMHIVHEKLKRLILDNTYFDFADYKELELHVRAPQLEELEILGNWFWTSCKLTDVLSLVRVRLDFFFGLYRDDVHVMCQNAVKELFERVRHSLELDVVIHCSWDLEKLEMESLCAALSHRKCLVLKVPTGDLQVLVSDDESSYEVHSDDE